MSLKINFNQLSQAGLKEIIEGISEACEYVGIDFYLIGALANQIWFSKANIKLRGTKDIDFAILIPDENKFNLFKNYLIEKGYTDLNQNPICVKHPNGTVIDLIPFSDITNEDRVIFNMLGFSNTAVNGINEVFQSGTATAEITNKKSFKISSLEGIVLLKLIAYNDRPDERVKDIHDIANILKHYFEIEEQYILDNHNDLFDIDGGVEIITVSAIVMGRKIRTIITGYPKLYKRLSDILKADIKSKFIERLAKELDFTLTEAQKILQDIQQGIDFNNK